MLSVITFIVVTYVALRACELNLSTSEGGSTERERAIKPSSPCDFSHSLISSSSANVGVAIRWRGAGPLDGGGDGNQ